MPQMRIREIQREVNYLLAQLGQPPRHPSAHSGVDPGGASVVWPAELDGTHG